jgi:hypothetical protein
MVKAARQQGVKKHGTGESKVGLPSGGYYRFQGKLVKLHIAEHSLLF